MSRYERLKERGFDADDSEPFDVGGITLDFLDKFSEGDAVLALRRQQQCNRDNLYTVPSTQLAADIFSKLQSTDGYPDYRLNHQQKLQQEQNTENGNPNICPQAGLTPQTVLPISSHSSTATVASLQEQQSQGSGVAGASPSGRWLGRNIEERSGRWRTVECESFHKCNSLNVVDNVHNSSARSSKGGQWAPSIQRGTYRDREPALAHRSPESLVPRVGSQPQEKQCCTLHATTVDTRHSHRYSKVSSPPESEVNVLNAGAEKRFPPSVMHPRSDASYGGSFAHDRGPTFQGSSSGREASGLQRSSSTKDTPGQRSEMSIENWRDHRASKSAHVSDRTKHRVSFSLTENHEVEAQKLREKFREPTAPGNLKSVQSKQQGTSQQSLRYNYEQPGFVEREKENICSGKAYTIYGVKEAKECPKESSGRHQLVRAFSLRENGSTYAKMPRAYSVNAGGRHLLPMECDTCGKGGIGIVFLGEHANLCKGCKSASGADWSCGDVKPLKKKKSIMDYCRKILRLPQKTR